MFQLMRCMLLTILVMGNHSPVSVTMAGQYHDHTVTIDVTPAHQVPGGVVSVTVQMSTLLDETRQVLEVNLPPELAVLGMPMCSGACSGAGITPGSNDMTANFDVGGYEPSPNRFGTLTFSASVSQDASPGSSLVINAFLGSPTASDSATVVITHSLPSEQVDAGVHVTPAMLRVTPGASALYIAQPLLWGDWSASDLVLRMEVRLPVGVGVEGEVICASRGATVPEINSCEISSEVGVDGSIVIGTYADVATASDSALHIPVKFGTELAPGEVLRIHTILALSGGGPIGNFGNGDFVTSYAAVVEPSNLAVAQDTSVIGRVEFTGSYSVEAERCRPASGMFDLIFYRWGDSEVVARLSSPTGYVGSTTDGKVQDACIMELALSGLDEDVIYSVARVPSGESIACRACYLGTITPTQQAIPVFVIE